MVGENTINNNQLDIIYFKKSDYDLDPSERKVKYKDYDRIPCEKCRQTINRNWYCKNCYENETEEEKYRMLYGICKACFEPMRIPCWCSQCNSYRFKQDFDKWTSNNKSIDELIRDSQTSAHSKYTLEWIPYNRFTDIKLIATGGFAEVYSATWMDGRIEKWDQKSKNWERSGSFQVALKVLNNSKNLSEDFLNELKFLKKFPSIYYKYVVECYGITQEPKSNYALVLKLKDCSLNSYLKKNYLSLIDKLYVVERVCLGLNCIHSHNIIHRDFHPGNILLSTTNNKPDISISDFGFCKPANENSSSEIYGVIQYIAPEILRHKGYTQASDIYSLGVVINEIFSRNKPFENESCDFLDLAICNGKRPEIREETPEPLKELIRKCWDKDSEKRPNTSQIYTMLQDIKKQFKEERDIIENHEIKITIDEAKEESPQVENNRYNSKLLNISNSLSFTDNTQSIHILVPSVKSIIESDTESFSDCAISIDSIM